MSWFTRKSVSDEERAHAQETLERVREQDKRVDELVALIRETRRRNHFGENIQKALRQ